MYFSSIYSRWNVCLFLSSRFIALCPHKVTTALFIHATLESIQRNCPSNIEVSTKIKNPKEQNKKTQAHTHKKWAYEIKKPVESFGFTWLDECPEKNKNKKNKPGEKSFHISAYSSCWLPASFPAFLLLLWRLLPCGPRGCGLLLSGRDHVAGAGRRWAGRRPRSGGRGGAGGCLTGVPGGHRSKVRGCFPGKNQT